MKVTVYYPSTAEGMSKISETAARVHSEIIKSKVQSLNLTKEEKLRLIDMVIERVNEGK